MTADGPDMSDQPVDPSDLMQTMMQMQQQLMDAQQAAAAEVVEGRAAGGLVTVKVTGGLDFQDVTIDPSAVDPDDVDMLQDLVLVAIRDAVEKANELNRQALGGLGLGGGLEGLLGGSSG